MQVFILKHVENEGPGTLLDYLNGKGIQSEIIELHADRGLPDLRETRAVITMGGPMNVYEDDKYPFLKKEAAFLGEAIGLNIPVLGICLGAQMIARACGAKVYKAPVKEVGWCDVRRVSPDDGGGILAGCPENLRVLQWHEDTFDIPDGGSLLATSDDCPHQAFQYKNAFGLQFHVEANRPMIEEWFNDSPRLEDMLVEYEERAEELDRNAMNILDNFMELAIR